MKSMKSNNVKNQYCFQSWHFYSSQDGLLLNSCNYFFTFVSKILNCTLCTKVWPAGLPSLRSGTVSFSLYVRIVNRLGSHTHRRMKNAQNTSHIFHTLPIFSSLRPSRSKRSQVFTEPKFIDLLLNYSTVSSIFLLNICFSRGPLSVSNVVPVISSSWLGI